MNIIINIALYAFSYISLNILMFFGFIPAGLMTFWLPKIYEKQIFQFFVGLFSSFLNIFACLLLFKFMSGNNQFSLQAFLISLIPIAVLAYKDIKRVFELTANSNSIQNASNLTNFILAKELSISTVVATTIGSITGTILWWIIFSERFVIY